MKKKKSMIMTNNSDNEVFARRIPFALIHRLAVASRVDQSRKADSRKRPLTHHHGAFFSFFREICHSTSARRGDINTRRRSGPRFPRKASRSRHHRADASSLRLLIRFALFAKSMYGRLASRASSKNLRFRWRLISFRNPSYSDTSLVSMNT